MLPTEKTVQIARDKTEIGEDAGDAACEKTKRHPTESADHPDQKSPPFFFGQHKGGDQAENHPNPIAALELQQRIQHKGV